MLSALASCLVGMLLGMRHALEPDHLSAISTLIVETGRPRRGAWLGAIWGLGHTLSLLIVGLLLSLLRVEMPARLTDLFEFFVCVLLVLFGARALFMPIRFATRRPAVRPSLPVWHRSFVLGVVHGLAGSGPLTPLIIAKLPTVTLRICYILVFGSGLIFSMAMLSGVAGLPLLRLEHRPKLVHAIAACTGALAITLGLVGGGELVARYR